MCEAIEISGVVCESSSIILTLSITSFDRPFTVPALIAMTTLFPVSAQAAITDPLDWWLKQQTVLSHSSEENALPAL